MMSPFDHTECLCCKDPERTHGEREVSWPLAILAGMILWAIILTGVYFALS